MADPYANTNKIAGVDVTDRAPDIQSARDTALVGWIMDNVEDWREYRDTNFLVKWQEYYRLWRGIWQEDDKTRSSERSKLISPALQQAIEAVVSELEEATFGREMWFDVVDDMDDPQKGDVQKIRDKLLEEFELNGVPQAISEVFLLSSIYGTGIAKVIIEEVEDKHVKSVPMNEEYQQNGVEVTEKFRCRLEPISPEEFVIDSSVNRPGKEGIEMALGMAHEIVKPLHLVQALQEEGVYNKGYVGGFDDANRWAEDVAAKGEFKDPENDARCKITEYYGKVPASLLGKKDTDEGSEGTGEDEGNVEYDESDLVEAIVTIANDGFLLKAQENPYFMQDRPIVAYQHDTVPNRFWGRGIAEKGYNAQKTLDAILRAQLDGLALTIHPMIAVDATRLPRGTNPTVAPGKAILTNGNPRDALMPFTFGHIDPISYNASADMERYIQMGTGAMDSASPLRTNRRNETASGMSMIMSGAIKRSKRTLANINRNFIVPMIQKAAWRYMEYNPEFIQPADYKFAVKGTLGMMAREMEVQNLVQVLQYMPPNNPGLPFLISAIIDHSSIVDKEQLKAAMQQQDPMAERQQQMQEQAASAKAQRDLATGDAQKVSAQAQMINSLASLGKPNKGQ